MSEYMFGLGPGHLSARAARVARKLDARLVNYTEPSGQRRHWFACDNLGAPFDSERAARVLDALRALGILSIRTKT